MLTSDKAARLASIRVTVFRQPVSYWSKKLRTPFLCSVALLLSLSNIAEAQSGDTPNPSVPWLAYARAQIAGDAMMQSQRLGRAAPGALDDEQDAFDQLESARTQLNRDLALLSAGGQYRGRTIPAASPSERVGLNHAQQDCANSVRAAVTIFERKSDVNNFYATLKKLNSMSPALLEMSEQVAALNIVNSATPRELSASGMLPMLSIRLSRSVNMFFGQQGIDPETAFLLGKDANTFHDIVDALLNGNQTLHLVKTKNKDIRAKLLALQASLDDYRDGIKSILDDLKNLIALKQSAFFIATENERVKNSLLALQESYQKVLDDNAW